MTDEVVPAPEMPPDAKPSSRPVTMMPWDRMRPSTPEMLVRMARVVEPEMTDAMMAWRSKDGKLHYMMTRGTIPGIQMALAGFLLKEC